MELACKAFRLLPLLAGAIVLVGCGGSGASSTPAKSGPAAVLLTIAWPARARAATTMVESVSVSVSVSVKVNDREAGRTILNRPPSDAATGTDFTFADLPAGSLATSLTSYTQADGAGELVATSQSTASLESGKTLAASATFAAGETDLILTTGKQTDTGSLAVGVH